MDFDLVQGAFVSARDDASLVSMLNDAALSQKEKEDAFDVLLLRPPMKDVLVLQLPDEYYDAYIAHLAPSLYTNAKSFVAEYAIGRYYEENAYRILIRAGRPDLLQQVAHSSLDNGIYEAIVQQDWHSFQWLVDKFEAKNSISTPVIADLPISVVDKLSDEDVEYIFFFVNVVDLLDTVRRLVLFRKKLPDSLTYKYPLLRNMNTYSHEKQLQIAFTLSHNDLSRNGIVHFPEQIDDFLTRRLTGSVKNTDAYVELVRKWRVTQPQYVEEATFADVELLYVNDALKYAVQVKKQFPIMRHIASIIGPYYSYHLRM